MANHAEHYVPAPTEVEVRHAVARFVHAVAERFDDADLRSGCPFADGDADLQAAWTRLVETHDGGPEAVVVASLATVDPPSPEVIEDVRRFLDRVARPAP